MSIVEERPEGERTVGEMMSNVFSIYSSHFAEVAIPFILAGLVSGFFSYTTYTLIPVNEIASGGYPAPSVIMDSIGRLILSVFFFALVSMVVFMISGGMVVKYTSDIIETGKGSVQQSFDETIARFPSLIAVSLITSLLIGVGFILLIAPGVILAIIFSLTIPVVMIEKRGALESLSRSQRLIDGHWKKTFGLLLMVGVLTGIASLLSVIFSPPPLGIILGTAVGSIIDPLYFIAITVLYHSMVIREQAGV
ncbi:MAG: hypothetical protein M1503_03450 [Thaumarchaeota archaeon]|nr:hypothetical protein [Nitrososphaerota archaeon]MCL5317309.1 hypothetical protein [Nitrososphaerota archaeon]